MKTRIKTILAAVLLLAIAVVGEFATAQPIPPAAMSAQTVGSPSIIGVIDCTTTSKTNGQATQAFNSTGTGLQWKTLLVYNGGSTVAHVRPVSTSTGLATYWIPDGGLNGYGVPIAAGAIGTIHMSDQPFLACIMASSTANLVVWELK